ncbi:hypothetical protein HOF65_06135 [bacterium]|nr:hypothetical protein [bacterium]MBT3853508.1 hypothetical protein [bacterium]MBT4632880.1 hypothetical protein [bacterium]MBT6778764.1 hypothetical protein [bacterium]
MNHSTIFSNIIVQNIINIGEFDFLFLSHLTISEQLEKQVDASIIYKSESCK